MNQNNIDIVCNTISDIFDTIGEKVGSAIRWASEHPRELMYGVGTVATLIRASRSLVVSHRVYSQNRLKERTFYDRKSGTTYILRRPLTNKEKHDVMLRRDYYQEDVYDILYGFGALK